MGARYFFAFLFTWVSLSRAAVICDEAFEVVFIRVENPKLPSARLSDMELARLRQFTEEDFQKMQHLDQGSESTVYRLGNEVYKVGEPYNAKGTAGARIAERLWADQLVGPGTLRVAGYWKGKNGVMNPVFVQPFIQGRKAKASEIERHMRSLGFVPVGGDVTRYSKRSPQGTIVVHDVDSDNVVVTATGDIRVIDASAYYE